MRCAALAILVAIALAGCTRSTSHARSSPPPASSASLPPVAGPIYQISARGTKLHPVTITNINHGKLEYILEAASVIYATNLQQGTFHDNILHFFKGARRRLTVTAPVATVDETSHNVYLSGGVIARQASGETLASDSMTYNEKTRLLTAVGHVVATSPSGYRLTGTRAIADLDLEQIRLFGSMPTEARSR